MRVRTTDRIVSSTLFVVVLFIVIVTTACDTTVAADGPVNLLQTATAGRPDYTDRLNDLNSSITQAAQWDVSGDGLGNKCEFGPNGYHVIQIAEDPLSLHACHENSNKYVNATIVVNVTILTGHSGGLFLRFSKDSYNNYTGYLFEIDNNRNYKFSIFTGINVLKSLNPLTVLKDWTFSSALKFGFNVTNTIAVIMKSNTFALYANHAYITMITDSSKTYNYGSVAFFASAANITTEVAFNKLNVYTLS